MPSIKLVIALVVVFEVLLLGKTSWYLYVRSGF